MECGHAYACAIHWPCFDVSSTSNHISPPPHWWSFNCECQDGTRKRLISRITISGINHLSRKRIRKKNLLEAAPTSCLISDDCRSRSYILHKVSGACNADLSRTDRRADASSARLKNIVCVAPVAPSSKLWAGQKMKTDGSTEELTNGRTNYRMESRLFATKNVDPVIGDFSSSRGSKIHNLEKNRKTAASRFSRRGSR